MVKYKNEMESRTELAKLISENQRIAAWYNYKLQGGKNASKPDALWQFAWDKSVSKADVKVSPNKLNIKAFETLLNGSK